MTGRIGVLGAGAWGTALAVVAAKAGNEVLIWSRNSRVVHDINDNRENALYLAGAPLPENIRAIDDAAELARCDAILLVVPAQHLRGVLDQYRTSLPKDIPLVLCAKGVEISSGLLMTEMLAEVMPDNPLAVLSGPTFAIEVARGLPTAVTLACADDALGQRLTRQLGIKTFRIYHSTDPVGAEIGGAVKNVIAIACGIVEGRGLGDNARAALITRGLSEIVKLGLAKGAQRETLMGLSGLGDLTLTCTATQSRNYALGLALGEGKTLEEHMAGRLTVAEGLSSSQSIAKLAEDLGVDMPICAAVRDVLHKGAAIDATIDRILARPQKSEL